MIDHEPSAARFSFPQEITGGGVVLTLLPGQAFVCFAESLSPTEAQAFLERHRLQPSETVSGHLPSKNVGEAPLREGRFRWTTGEDTARFIAEIRADDRVRTASPVYHCADLLPARTETSFSDQVLIHFGPQVSEKEIGLLIAGLDTEVVGTEPFAREGTLYQLRLHFPKRQDIFAIVDQFARSLLVRYAGPDWIQLHSPACTTTPNDPMFGQQWNLDKISAPEGWNYTRGTPRVVIAIIDSGCDLGHPDLVDKYVPEADRFDVLTNTHTPNDLYRHGTMCAGVAAAVTDNHIGVAGVAPNCSIMPIRMWDGTNNVGIRSQLDIVQAVNWARTHGADVISMSLYYDGPPHDLADIALEDAYQANVVLVGTAGNCFPDKGCADPKGVVYPGSHPRVIAVGATDKNDRRQTHTNGFNPAWDSRYGPELSVMAPGVFCPTTYIYGGYADDFYGTSAAAPHVAGLAALLLSLLQHPVNIPPSVQMNDLVRSIIERTAAKVGGYTYATDATHPNGAWNAEMGYGRIDVAYALSFALYNYTTYPQEQVSRNYAIAVQILLGLTSGGPGIVVQPGGPPVPVDPGWLHLRSEKRDVLLGLAMTELAEGISDAEMRRALRQSGWNAIERTAQRMGQDS